MGQPFIGEIRMFASSFAPAGWAFCDGALMPISENDALFNLIGTTYGGDGQSTFALPNLQSRVPIHAGAGPSGTVYTRGEMAGVEEVTLTTQQIPAHTHAVTVSGDAGAVTDPTGAVVGSNPTIQLFRPGNATSALNATAMSPVGGSQPHTNIQPYLAITFIISLFGIYPQQT